MQLIKMLLLVTLFVAVTIIEGCEPGSEEVQVDNTTVTCKRCESGYFSFDGSECKKCSKCHRGQKEVTQCFLDRDRDCLCPSGEYLNVDTCTPCRDCPHGFKQTGECESNKDRECEPCNKGFTANITNGRYCVVEQKPSDPKSRSDTKNDTSQKPLIIIIFCTSTVALVACFIVGIAIIMIKRKNRSRPMEEEEPMFMEDLPMTSPHVQAPPSQRRLRVKDTNVDIGEISLKLNHITREKKNWLHLAQKLDMSPEIINNIRRADNPTERLIDYYDTTENASVQDFIQNLKSMRRSSTAYILQVALENTNARLCSGEGNWV